MKLLFLILLLPFITKAQLQPAICGGKMPATDLSGYDLSGPYKVVYQGRPQKYDTTGPMLRLVSDTSHDHWNGVSAMWVYEVNIYIPNVIGYNIEHYKWLDSKKKPLTLKVWTDFVESPALDSFDYSRARRKYSMELKEFNHDNPYQ